MEKSCLNSLLTDKVKGFVRPVILTHNKKLLNLRRKQFVTCPSCIVNAGKKILTIRKTNALRFGLKNPILERRVQKEKIKVDIEKLFYLLKWDPKVTINDQVRDDVKFIFRKFITDSRGYVPHERTKHSTKHLKIQPKTTQLKFCLFDKESGVAVLDTNDYNAKLDATIGD